ncbi:histidine phosphatase family protein [Mariniblastus sp.]|nr:histidine phosphatase family protein [Mariniblastus sp.]
MISTLIKTNVRSKILFVPRAFTELDDQNRICGSLDLPLSDEGVAQATEWAKSLEGVEFDSIVAAAGIADKETAKILKGKRRVKIRVESSWLNLDHGLWQGKCIDSLKENCNKYYRQWQENPEAVAPPSGETTGDLAARVEPAFVKCLKKRAGEIFVVVAPQPLLGVLRQLAEEAKADVECRGW